MRRISGDVAALLLRVAAGLIFLPHGWAKVMGDGGVAAFAHDLPGYGIPSFLGYVAAWSELAGGVLLIVGLLTRLDAFLLACTMAVAAFVVKLPDALYEAQPGSIKLFVVMKGIQTEAALLAITLALVFLGGGRFSLDALLRLDDRVARAFRRGPAPAAAA